MKKLLWMLVWLMAGQVQAQPTVAEGQNWTHYVRIAGHGLNIENVV